jgi:hypothetical protein
LELSEYLAARLKSPDENTAKDKLDAFRIEREENSLFPGDWEPLKGKMVKIYTVQPVSQDQIATGPRAKLSFASALLRKYAAETTASAPALDGIVVIFDAVDGGIIGSTLLNVQQLAGGSLSQENFWRHCYVDPPDAFRLPAATDGRASVSCTANILRALLSPLNCSDVVGFGYSWWQWNCPASTGNLYSGM